MLANRSLKNRSLTGSSGGILTAWSDSSLSSIGSYSTSNTLSVHLASTASNLSLFVTNVYAPSTPDLRPAFLDELKSLSPPNNIPWMLCGDFNIVTP